MHVTSTVATLSQPDVPQRRKARAKMDGSPQGQFAHTFRASTHSWFEHMHPPAQEVQQLPPSRHTLVTYRGSAPLQPEQLPSGHVHALVEGLECSGKLPVAACLLDTWLISPSSC